MSHWLTDLPGNPVDTRAVTWFTVTMTKTQTTVYEFIKQNPGSWLGTVSSKTGLRAMHVSNAVIKMEALGLVREDERARWYVA